MSATTTLRKKGARMLRGPSLRAVVQALELGRDAARQAVTEARTDAARCDFQRLAEGYAELAEVVSAARTLVLLPEDLAEKVRG